MTFKEVNSFSFKLTSFFPLAWIISLYAFLISCIIDLGHYPIPSMNDPKGIRLKIFYEIVWIGYFPFFFGSILWAVNFIFSFYYKTTSKKHLIIFGIGLAISLIQIILDPGNVIYWYLD